MANDDFDLPKLKKDVNPDLLPEKQDIELEKNTQEETEESSNNSPNLEDGTLNSEPALSDNNIASIEEANETTIEEVPQIDPIPFDLNNPFSQNANLTEPESIEPTSENLQTNEPINNNEVESIEQSTIEQSAIEVTTGPSAETQLQTEPTLTFEEPSFESNSIENDWTEKPLKNKKSKDPIVIVATLFIIISIIGAAGYYLVSQGFIEIPFINNNTANTTPSANNRFTLEQIITKFNESNYGDWLIEELGNDFDENAVSELYAEVIGNNQFKVVGVFYDFENEITAVLNYNVLSISVIPDNDLNMEELLLSIMMKAFLTNFLIDTIGQLNGFEQGELLDLQDHSLEWTFEENGIEITENEDTIQVRIDLSRELRIN